MVDAAVKAGAGPGALEGARGSDAAVAKFAAGVVPPLLPWGAEEDPRLWERELPLPEVLRLPLP